MRGNRRTLDSDTTSAADSTLRVDILTGGEGGEKKTQHTDWTEQDLNPDRPAHQPAFNHVAKGIHGSVGRRFSGRGPRPRCGGLRTLCLPRGGVFCRLPTRDARPRNALVQIRDLPLLLCGFLHLQPLPMLVSNFQRHAPPALLHCICILLKGVENSYLGPYSVGMACESQPTQCLVCAVTAS